MNAQSQKTVANCAELKIHIYECRKEPYLAVAYALVLNLGYGFFLRLASVFDKFKRQPRAGLRRALGATYHFTSDTV